MYFVWPKIRVITRKSGFLNSATSVRTIFELSCGAAGGREISFWGFPLEKFRPIMSVRFPFMDASSSVSHPAHDPHQHDAHDHHELPFWRKYIISTDHKVIGIQYGITGLIFLFFGFCLMMLMRWQLAYPGKALPVIGNVHRAHARPWEHDERGDDAGVLQLVRRDARHDHGLPRDCADGLRRLREFRCAAADRRSGYDVPEDQHGELPGVFRRRRRSCW